MTRSKPTLVFASSRDYARLTGGWVYNSHLAEGLSKLGWAIEGLDLPAGFPNPDAATRTEAQRLLAGLPDGALVMVDQICLSPLAEFAVSQKERLRWVMIFHHPMAMENEAAQAEMRRRADAERLALSATCLVIATSKPTAERLARDYGVLAGRIVTAEPGMDRVRHSAGVPIPADGVINLLTLGAVVPRKGYELMIAALSRLADLPWRLTIVGDTERAPDYVAALRGQIDEAGLQKRIRLAGGIDAAALEALWRSAHVFVASSRHEGYGMAVAEAIARALPTVTTDAGTIREWLDPDAAIIVGERTVEAFTEALRSVIGDPDERARLGRNALGQAQRFATWAMTAQRVHERLIALAAAQP